LSGLSCRERGATVGLVGRNVVLHR
jgi:hypothetical protein